MMVGYKVTSGTSTSKVVVHQCDGGADTAMFQFDWVGKYHVFTDLKRAQDVATVLNHKYPDMNWGVRKVESN